MDTRNLILLTALLPSLAFGQATAVRQNPSTHVLVDPTPAQFRAANGILENTNLPISLFASGTGATNSTFWRGDGTWSPINLSPPGASGQAVFNISGAYGVANLWYSPNVLEIRSGTNPQELQIFNSYTSGSNYMRAGLGFSSNRLVLSTSAAGAGSSTFSFPFTLSLDPTTGAIFRDSIVGGGSTHIGNARGVYAVDLQSYRTAATQVASGGWATISGGNTNTATAGYAVIGGGRENTINTGLYATIAGGYSNTATGQHDTIGGGYQNSSLGYSSTIGGGQANSIVDAWATIPGGLEARASRLEYAYATGKFSAAGDNQLRRFIVRGSTIDATPLVLSAANDVQLQMRTSQAGLYDLKILGKTSGASPVVFSSTRKVTISRPSVGDTTLVGSVQTIGTDENAGGWSVAVTADTVGERLHITVTGAAATTIRWMAIIEGGEIVF